MHRRPCTPQEKADQIGREMPERRKAPTTTRAAEKSPHRARSQGCAAGPSRMVWINANQRGLPALPDLEASDVSHHGRSIPCRRHQNRMTSSAKPISERMIAAQMGGRISSSSTPDCAQSGRGPSFVRVSIVGVNNWDRARRSSGGSREAPHQARPDVGERPLGRQAPLPAPKRSRDNGSARAATISA